jgi:hypothetical protein
LRFLIAPARFTAERTGDGYINLAYLDEALEDVDLGEALASVAAWEAAFIPLL